MKTETTLKLTKQSQSKRNEWKSSSIGKDSGNKMNSSIAPSEELVQLLRKRGFQFDSGVN